jgi:ribosome maturation factor RimP
MKGTKSFPSSFLTMEVNELKDRIYTLIEPLLQEDPSYFLVHIKVKPGHIIRVYIDGDQGLPIKQCTSFNRRLYKAIEEAAWFPEGDFALEVSSPGVDEPLVLNRQYVKNIGRNVEVILNDETVYVGNLKEVTDKDILIEWTAGKGKKATQEQLLIPFDNIKSTIVQIQF